MMTSFTYTAAQAGNGVAIELTETKTGKVKTFLLAVACLERMRAHMESLTDLCCVDWFKPRKSL